MKFIIVLSVLAFCHCNVLNGRQADENRDQNRDVNLNRIIGLKQFEEWLRLLQSQMSRLSNQFNRLITPREGRLSANDLIEAKQTLRKIDETINGLNGVLSRDSGALQSDRDSNGNRDFSLSRVPILGEVEEMLRLAQKQITDISSTMTKALTGGLDLKGTAAEEMNKNIDGTVMSQVPFLKEFEEYLELFQKQINRLGGTVQRVIQGGGAQVEQVNKRKDN